MAGARAVEVVLTNAGSKPVDCRVANAYADGPGQALTLAPGARGTLTLELSASAGWYDVAIMMPDAPRYLRRFAGHHEDGRPSTSDPGPRVV
jgi:phospholipase C